MDEESKRLIRFVSDKLYKIAAIVYLISLASRTIFEKVAYSSDLESYSRPLASVLRFIVSELQMLTTPFVATVFLVIAFILRPTIISFVDRAGHRSVGDE